MIAPMRRAGAAAAVMATTLACAPAAAAQAIPVFLSGAADALTYNDALGVYDNLDLVEPTPGTLVVEERNPEVDGLSLTDQCAETRPDLFTCVPQGEQRLVFSSGAFDDVIVASGVREMPLNVLMGPGYDVVLGGGGDDTLDGGDNVDLLAGGPGEDLLTGSEGSDVLEGGPGRDRINGDIGTDTVFAVDGDPDTIDCGPGDDVALIDRADRQPENCEVVEFVRVKDPPPPVVAPPPPTTTHQPKPGANGGGEVMRARGLARVLRFPPHCLGQRGAAVRIGPAAGFVPRSATLYVDGRRAATRRGRRMSLPVRRPGRLTVVVRGRDGRTLRASKRIRRC